MNAALNRAAATTSRVSWKSCSVSPGKPTIRSVVIAACGMAVRTLSRIDKEALGAVRAAHGPQHPVRTGLHRHVKGRADIRCLRHRLDDVVGELGRVRRGEPHPLQAVDAPACAQQLGERAAVARLIGVGERDAVGVDVLPEQRHLEDALVHQGLHLGQHVARPAVDLLAAQRRHDAERAGVVAADGDRNPSGVGGFARDGQVGRKLLQRLDDFDLGRLVVPGAVEQRRQRPDVVGAEDDVHPRRLPQHRVAVLLGQAAADGDLHVRDRTVCAARGG